MASVRVQCPKCFSQYSIDPVHLGRRGQCTKCNTLFVLTALPEAVTRTFQTGRRPSSSSESEASAERWKVGDIILDVYEVRPLRPDKPFAEGGMGVVYRVYHHGWGIDLAVKSPKADEFRSEEGKRNFERECEAWMRLGLHPNIVTCYYVRRIAGIPRVFAEFVDGGTLWEWIRDRRLYEGGVRQSLLRILDIAIQIAWGLNHAHEHGVIHQDVKPENVLMKGEVPKVTDFGLARARWAASAAPVQSTQGSLTVSWGGMTPAYCSPEQIQAAVQAESGVPADQRVKLTRGTDIWSWAVTVLAMFFGRAPCRFGGHTAAEVFESYLKQGPPERFLPKMPEGVVELLRRCFRRDPQERPRDMVEISDWLRGVWRDLTGQRYPRYQPTAADLRADSLNNRAASLLDLGNYQEALQSWSLAWREHPWQPQVTFNRALLEWRGGRLTDLELVSQLEELCKNRPQAPEAFFALGLAQMERFEAKLAVEALETALQLGGGPEVASALEEARKMLADMPRCLRSFTGQPPHVTEVYLGARGDRVLSGLDGRTMRLWEVESGRTLTTLEVPALVGSISTSADGRWQLRRSRDGQFVVQQAAMPSTAEVFRRIEWGRADRLETPDGKHVVVATEECTIELRQLADDTLVRVFRGHTAPVRSLAVSADGAWLLSGSSDKTLRLWEVATGRCLRTLKGHTDPVSGVYLSADARWALSCSTGRTLRLWRLGPITDPQRRFMAPILLCQVTSSEEAGRVQNQYVELVLKARMAMASEQYAEALQYTRAARQLPGYRMTRELLELWNRIGRRCIRRACADGWSLQVLEAHSGEVRCVTFCQGAKRLLSAGVDGTVRWWTLDDSGEEPAIISAHADWVSSVVCRPGGDIFASAGHDRVIRLWSCESKNAIGVIEAGAPINDLVFSPSGRYLFSAGWDRVIREWDVASTRCVRTFAGHEKYINALDISLDGRWLLSAGEDQTIRLWDIRTGEAVRVIKAHGDWVLDVAFLPDGKHAVSAGKDWTIKLWNLQTGECIRQLTGHEGPVHALAVTPDGQFLVSAGKDRAVRIWDLGSGSCQRVLLGHTGSILTVAISPDSRWVLSAGEDETIRLWELDWEYEFPGWSDWDERAEGVVRAFLACRGRLPLANGAALPNGQGCDREWQLLLEELENRGLGWIRPQGVEKRIRQLLGSPSRA
ncbi:MAG: protein kinase [Thermoguttaceae bacterium]|nr:protein kinase [Thermoguttaceae bacterium]MDW8077896.1 protein kinase [Thermoguttaceae bacterium]